MQINIKHAHVSKRKTSGLYSGESKDWVREVGGIIFIHCSSVSGPPNSVFPLMLEQKAGTIGTASSQKICYFSLIPVV